VVQAREIFRGYPLEVLQAACVTVEREGQRLVDFSALREVGVEFFSDDGSVVPTAALMAETLSESERLGFLVAEHAQDESLGSVGVVNAGVVADELGLRGMPEMAETVIVARDLALQREIGGRLHLMHLSSVGSLLLLESLAGTLSGVSTEVTPHHLLLNDDTLRLRDTSYKVNPPLRSEESRVRLVDAVSAGLIDVVGTDHAPHAPWKKTSSFEDSAFGLIGLQSAFAATLTALFRRERLDESPDSEKEIRVLSRVFQLMAYGPRRVLGRARDVRVGDRADIVIVDPAKQWILGGSEIASTSKNSPYVGRTVLGKVFGLIDGGVVKVWNESLEIDVKRG
jgi:dihydroorotase